jgi:hypothetical protein
MEGLMEFNGTIESIKISREDQGWRKLIVGSALVGGKVFTFADVDTGKDFDKEFFNECSLKGFERSKLK